MIPKSPMYLPIGCPTIAFKMPGDEWNPFLPPWRPMVHSAQQMGRPIMRKAIQYANIKAPPPNCAAWPGKRKKFPRPTALPATARMIPRREFHDSFD